MKTCVRSVVCSALLVASGSALAQPVTPVYERTLTDCTTGDNSFVFDGLRYWSVDAGCDSYQVDTYERPTVKRFDLVGAQYATNEYFEYLDITGASVGADNRWLYVRIDLFGVNRSTDVGDNIPTGLIERYALRFSTDPDGRFGVMIQTEDPQNKNQPNTVFGPLGVFGYRDTNGDVGGAATSGPTGLSVTKSDNTEEESGLNGYDEAFIQDGSLATGLPIAFVRIDPADPTAIEIVVDYIALGFTPQTIRDLRFFDVEAVKGAPADGSSRHWNDKFAREEAGSPNPGPGGASEFGTQGLESIYECDTLRIGGLPALCAADWNRDGAVNSTDVSDFINDWFVDQLKGSLVTDFDANGVSNSTDVSEFINRWFIDVDACV